MNYLSLENEAKNGEMEVPGFRALEVATHAGGVDLLHPP